MYECILKLAKKTSKKQNGIWVIEDFIGAQTQYIKPTEGNLYLFCPLNTHVEIFPSLSAPLPLSHVLCLGDCSSLCLIRKV